MGYDDNVYYNPEKYGLVRVDSIDWDEESYQFNVTAIFKDERGQYYIAEDSGCSCPMPFEDYNSLEDLDGPHNRAGAESILRYRLNNYETDDRYGYGRTYADLVSEVNKIISTL